MKASLITSLLLVMTTTSAHAMVIINEVLGSTTGADSEFIELYNTSASAISIGGWSVELWDSDSGGAFGNADGDSPYVIDAGAMIEGFGFYTLANGLAESLFAFAADQSLPSNAIENSSYTIILADAANTALNSIFVTDGDAGDTANRAGTSITPDFAFGPDGTFLPAGFFREFDGADTLLLQSFSDFTDTGTPGATNDPSVEPPLPSVPLPASLLLMMTGLWVMVARRR
ncbi:MAG: lamin tail domain-containing protein [Candidatus Competibacterales bacterium]